MSYLLSIFFVQNTKPSFMSQSTGQTGCSILGLLHSPSKPCLAIFEEVQKTQEWPLHPSSYCLSSLQEYLARAGIVPSPKASLGFVLHWWQDLLGKSHTGEEVLLNRLGHSFQNPGTFACKIGTAEYVPRSISYRTHHSPHDIWQQDRNLLLISSLADLYPDIFLSVPTIC